jgi:hypothetical protein
MCLFLIRKKKIKSEKSGGNGEGGTYSFQTKTGARTTKNKPKKLSFVQSEDMTGEVENQIGVKFEDGVALRENCYIINVFIKNDICVDIVQSINFIL